jgi:hypothetical protein
LFNERRSDLDLVRLLREEGTKGVWGHLIGTGLTAPSEKPDQDLTPKEEKDQAAPGRKCQECLSLDRRQVATDQTFQMQNSMLSTRCRIQ